MSNIDKEPLISILMNCFNGEEFLKESIGSLIQQTYKNWELIFWDNQSSDKSIEIASLYKDKRIFIFKSRCHTNLGKARQNAFKKVRGNYLAFLDVDDLWEKEKLMKQLKEFRDPNIGISFTNAHYFSIKRREKLYKNKTKFEVNTKSLITNYPLSLNSIMIDVNKLKSLSYDFDENYNHICDFDLMIRLSSISKVKYLNETLSSWRIHGENESFKRKELFFKELEHWCNYHFFNNHLNKYKKEIIELETLTFARKRIASLSFYYQKLNYKNIKDIRNIRNFKNRIFYLYSLIPIIPKIIFEIKEIIYKFKWF